MFVSSPSEAQGAHVLAHACLFLWWPWARAAPPATPSGRRHSVNERLEWRLEGMGRLPSDRFARAESRADFRRGRDDGPAHDAGSTAADDSHRPVSHAETFSEQSTSRTKGDAACEAMMAFNPSTRTTRRGEAPPRAKVRGCRRGRVNLQRRHQGHL